MRLWKIGSILLGVLILFLGTMCFLLHQVQYTEQDVVEVNRVIRTCETTWDELNEIKLKESPLEFEVLNLQGKILFASSNDSVKTRNEAIRDRDTLLNIEVDGQVVGLLIVQNENKVQLNQIRKRMVGVTLISGVCLAGILLGYLSLLYYKILYPFYKLRGFAEHIARGNFDFPLRMEKSNYFGEFTQSLDIMREELGKARENERLASESKKELVAKLSHDIKTPIASIKAVSELMLALSKEGKMCDKLRIILEKADQIDLLVSNMFHATLEELQELEVKPEALESLELMELISTSDYNGYVTMEKVPACIIIFDRLRLQQVMDNVISNSYKYANTSIRVHFEMNEDFLEIEIKDFGKGISEEELSLVFNKFRRGKNAEGINGTGLGLYISEYFMKQMGGKISCYNVLDGFCVKLSLALAR